MEQEHHHINTSQWDDHSHHSSQGKANQQLERDDKGHFDGMEGSLIGDYRILREVGQGTFGRVVECLDTRQRYSRTGVRDRRPHNGIVAIKVIRNVKRYHDSALIEADIVRSVNRRGGRGITHCAILYDTFTYHGHFCMVFESLGPSLYDFLKDWMNFHPFPADYVRSFAQQLLETVEFLHR
jgi:serine/threonine protein kinase